MKIMDWVQADEFYDAIERLFGIGFEEFQRSFKSCIYLDEHTYNTIELTIEINGVGETFIIDAV
jgi:hypothetical protein